MITLTFQVAVSLFQPLVGFHTDKDPLPYFSAIGMGFTLAGVTALAFAPNYPAPLAVVLHRHSIINH